MTTQTRPTRGRKQTIEVQIASGPRSVDATVYSQNDMPVLAIHKSIDALCDPWTISYIPAGLAVEHTWTKRQAREVVVKLLVLDWTQPDTPERRREMSPQVRQILWGTPEERGITQER